MVTTATATSCERGKSPRTRAYDPARGQTISPGRSHPAAPPIRIGGPDRGFDTGASPPSRYAPASRPSAVPSPSRNRRSLSVVPVQRAVVQGDSRGHQVRRLVLPDGSVRAVRGANAAWLQQRRRALRRCRLRCVVAVHGDEADDQGLDRHDSRCRHDQPARRFPRWPLRPAAENLPHARSLLLGRTGVRHGTGRHRLLRRLHVLCTPFAAQRFPPGQCPVPTPEGRESGGLDAAGFLTLSCNQLWLPLPVASLGSMTRT